VIFLTKGCKTEKMWVYDGRSNVPHITKKDRPLVAGHFTEFEKCFGAEPNGRGKRKSSDSKEDRWHSFSIDEISEREYKIDGLKWLKDEILDVEDGLHEPEELAQEAISELEAALGDLRQTLRKLEGEAGV
jgi:type I restriction enzyme M protein